MISQFFGICAPTVTFARVFASDSSDSAVQALKVAEAACQLLWVGSLVVLAFALSTTPQPPLTPPVPAYIPAPSGYLGVPKDRATPSPLGIRSSPVPSTRTASVIDIGPNTGFPIDEKEKAVFDSHFDSHVVELRDPTALLHAAILRSFSVTTGTQTISQQSSPEFMGAAFEAAIRSHLGAGAGDFTLALPYTPPVPQTAAFPPPPPAAPAPAPAPKPGRRPRTSASLRQTLSRLLLPPRPATAPTPNAAAPASSSSDLSIPPTPPSPPHGRTPLCSDANCTCELGYAYEGFPQPPRSRGTRPDSGRSWSWVGELDTEGFTGVERGVVGRRPRTQEWEREGVKVEVESESDVEKEQGRKGMEIERE